MKSSQAIEEPDLLEQVERLRRGGRAADALALCQRELQAHSSSSAARGSSTLWVMAGALAAELRRSTEAADYYGEAVRLDPGAFGTHYNLGNALAQLRRDREAAASFRNAISLNPYFVPAHKNLSQVLYRLGEFAAAVAACEQALRSGSPKAELYRNLGTAQWGAGDLRAATASFRKALQLRPGWAKGLQSLTNVLMEQADFGAARASCDTWLSERPADTEALGLKSIALAELVQAGRSAREQALDRLELARLMDMDGLVRVFQLTEPPRGFASMSEFNAALGEQALRHSTLRVPPPNDPTYHGDNLRITGEFLADPSRLAHPGAPFDRSPTVGLRHLVQGALDAYMQQISSTHSDHPFVLNAPSRVRLTGWAAVLESGGSLQPHVHYRSHVSAVYYAKIPSEICADGTSRAGWLEFGSIPTRYRVHSEHVRALKPREGMLVVFPSYFYHATLPFTSAEPRISIAFDVVGMG